MSDAFENPDLSYGDYLGLDRLLAAQAPLSDSHDELLFIIIHQASELWIKLSIHELTGAKGRIAADDLGAAFKMIARVSRMQTQLIQSWDVLATMTPSDYHAFRPSLGQSSGFQSYQYRELEFLLGNKTAGIGVHASDPEIHAHLHAVLAAPSLYDECIALLHRRGFAEGVEAAWLTVYREPDRHWDLYELAEKLVDLEFRFQQWRFAHLKTVERIIGHKMGTGGTGGVSYLAKALEQSFFPELLSVRTSI